jgi:phenol hydroxylase P5 protein
VRTCKVQTVDGEIEHGEASPFALMDFEREEAKCLACCATPMSDLTIEADIDPEPDAQFLPLMDFTAEVTRIEALTPTIKGVFLRVEGVEGALRCASSRASTSTYGSARKPRRARSRSRRRRRRTRSN